MCTCVYVHVRACSKESGVYMCVRTCACMYMCVYVLNCDSLLQCLWKICCHGYDQSRHVIGQALIVEVLC